MTNVRVHVIVTSPRVAPGLLSAEAWALLTGPSRVAAADPSDPIAQAVQAAGVEVVMNGGFELLRNMDWLQYVFGQDFDPSLYRMLLFGIAMVGIMLWRHGFLLFLIVRERGRLPWATTPRSRSARGCPRARRTATCRARRGRGSH